MRTGEDWTFSAFVHVRIGLRRGMWVVMIRIAFLTFASYDLALRHGMGASDGVRLSVSHFGTYHDTPNCRYEI